MLSLIDATGSWTPWTEWSQCSASCGSGSRLRTRTCSGDSSLCVGEVAEAETCETTDCQGNIFLWNPPGIVLLIIPATVVTKGEKRKCFIATKTFFIASWTSWTEWTQCSASCGSGSRLRTRACIGDSILCVGDLTETEACETTDCQGAYYNINIQKDTKHYHIFSIPF